MNISLILVELIDIINLKYFKYSNKYNLSQIKDE